MQNGLMRRLARRSQLSKKVGIRYVEGCWPYLEIDHPVELARLIGEAKQDAKNGRVFLRGQVRHHEAMLPSLFRSDNTRSQELRKAEKDLAERIHQSIPVGRFAQRDLPALLQHYGFRTSWLDAVDNLFVAVWFATNELRPSLDSLFDISPSQQKHGWIYLIASAAGSRRLRLVDLRIEHQPLSSRPHVQHGVSLTRQDPNEHDLRDFVAATVRFPRRSFRLTGSLFEGSFLFPPPDNDHTLRLLMRRRANDIAAGIESTRGLSPLALGRVSQLRSSTLAAVTPIEVHK